MRRKISSETWEQIRTGCASGISVREIACEIEIPEGTPLSLGKTRKLDAKHQKAVVKQLKMINAYLFDQTNHAIAYRARLISLRFYVPVF